MFSNVNYLIQISGLPVIIVSVIDHNELLKMMHFTTKIIKELL